MTSWTKKFSIELCLARLVKRLRHTANERERKTSAQHRPRTSNRMGWCITARSLLICFGASNLSGCVTTPDFYHATSGAAASAAAKNHCKRVAQQIGTADISTGSGSASQIGELIGGSLADAIGFRDHYVKCMESSGYVRNS